MGSSWCSSLLIWIKLSSKLTRCYSVKLKEIYNHCKNFVKATFYLIWRKNNWKRVSKFFHIAVQSLDAVSWQIFRENTLKVLILLTDHLTNFFQNIMSVKTKMRILNRRNRRNWHTVLICWRKNAQEQSKLRWRKNYQFKEFSDNVVLNRLYQICTAW